MGLAPDRRLARTSPVVDHLRQPGERRRAGRVRGAVRPAGRRGVGAARPFPGDLRRGCALPLRHRGGTQAEPLSRPRPATPVRPVPRVRPRTRRGVRRGHWWKELWRRAGRRRRSTPARPDSAAVGRVPPATPGVPQGAGWAVAARRRTVKAAGQRARRSAQRDPQARPDHAQRLRRVRPALAGRARPVDAAARPGRGNRRCRVPWRGSAFGGLRSAAAATAHRVCRSTSRGARDSTDDRAEGAGRASRGDAGRPRTRLPRQRELGGHPLTRW